MPSGGKASKMFLLETDSPRKSQWQQHADIK